MTTLLRRADSRSSAIRGAKLHLPARSDTPTWTRIIAAVTIAIVVVLAVVLARAAGTVHDSFDVVGHKTAPQVTATEDLSFALADMDAQLANVLLAGNDPRLAKTRADALAAYEQRRTQADADLERATSIAGADESAHRLIRDILDQIGSYEGLAVQTILLNQREGNPAGRLSPDVLDSYRQATDLMHATLNNAHRLTDANSAVLQRANDNTHSTTVSTRLWLAILGLLLIGTLIGLQVWLRITARRRLNPALVLATLVATVLVVGGFGLMGTASAHLTTAKKDAFDSLLALRQARAVSYDANADESRYLVDPDRASKYQRAFLDKSESLAGVKASSIDTYDAALDSAMRAYRANNTDIRIGGFFGTELNNITFKGERQAAEQTLTAFQQYERDDRTIRAKARTDLRDAIAFDTSTDPGNSNYDFDTYDKALAGLIDINQRAFDQAIADGEHAIGGWTGLVPYGAAGLVVALVVIGIWPRLSEYR